MVAVPYIYGYHILENVFSDISQYGEDILLLYLSDIPKYPGSEGWHW